MGARAWVGVLVVVSLALCGCSIPASSSRGGGTGGGEAGGGSTGGGSGGATVRAEGLSLITEPGPGDTPFIALIDSARERIEVTMYELTDERVEQALAAAAARGVRVEVLLDDGQYGAGRALNDDAYRYLAT